MPLISLIPSLPLLGRRNVLNCKSISSEMHEFCCSSARSRAARTLISEPFHRCLFSCFAAARAACVSTWLGETYRQRFARVTPAPRAKLIARQFHIQQQCGACLALRPWRPWRCAPRASRAAWGQTKSGNVGRQLPRRALRGSGPDCTL